MLEATPPTSPNPWLRCEVEDAVGLYYKAVEISASKIYGHEVEVVPSLSVREIGELLRASVVVVEAVDADNGVAVAKQ
jgi:hypothetical protein